MKGIMKVSDVLKPVLIIMLMPAISGSNAQPMKSSGSGYIPVNSIITQKDEASQ